MPTFTTISWKPQCSFHTFYCIYMDHFEKLCTPSVLIKIQKQKKSLIHWNEDLRPFSQTPNYDMNTIMMLYLKREFWPHSSSVRIYTFWLYSISSKQRGTTIINMLEKKYMTKFSLWSPKNFRQYVLTFLLDPFTSIKETYFNQNLINYWI